MKLVKICDVKNIYEARSLAELGVNFIGLHYISPNDRARKQDLKMIIKLCHQDHPMTKTIIVTKERSVDVIIDLVSEFECDGIQLHYPVDSTIFARLRSHFGKSIILFGVVTPDRILPSETLNRVDYIIIDKSYTGGTGTQLSVQNRSQVLKMHKNHKLLIAGGVDSKFINEVNDTMISGYDIQSSVKSDSQSQYENISLSKLRHLMQTLNKHTPYPSRGQVGLSCTASDNLLDFYGACDFWHFDFFDDVFGYNTNVRQTIEKVKAHSTVNSHFRFQIHIFSHRINYVNEIIEATMRLPVKTLELYIHHSTQTVSSFKLTDPIYASLDTKDVISGSFPLRKALSRDKIVLCLQSEKHTERGTNANAAMRLIKDLWKKKVRVTLDRGIFPSDLNYTFDERVDIVSGRYLHEHMKDGYSELRRSLHNDN